MDNQVLNLFFSFGKEEMEEWKDIKNHEEFYQISSHGQVKNKKTNKILIGDINSTGYRRVILYNPYKQRYFVHRLVAEHFCKNDDEQNKTIVNHIDGNKLNNYYTNLEWTTKSENDKHAFRNNLRQLQGVALNQKIISEKRILMYDKDTKELVRIFENIEQIVKEYNMNREYISQCCRGYYCFKGKYLLEREK